MAPMALAHCPAQLTTISASMSPWSVCTPVTAPFAEVIPMTRVRSKTRAPFMRAPLASDCVTSVGLAVPSNGSQMAPCRSDVSRIG